MSTPAVLLPYQQRWVADNADVAVDEKSRRVGLSWADASAAVLTASQAGGQDALYIGYSEDMAREYVDAAAMWARNFNLAASAMDEVMVQDEGRDIKAFRIDFASGSKVLALSSRPRSIRGKQGRVTIDEAAFHDDLEGLLKAALAMLIWGGRVRVISSHNGAENPFNQTIGEIRAGKLPYSLHRTTIDDALADGLYRRICLVKGEPWSADGEAAWRADLFRKYGDAADEELLCIPREGGGKWLSRALIEARMIDAPVLRWKGPQGFETWPEHLRVAEVRDWLEAKVKPLLELLDPQLLSCFGWDFARKGDLSVMSPAQREQSLRLRVPFLLELSNVPFEQQKQILYYIADRLPRLAAGALDARGNGQYLAEVAMQRYGATRIHQVMLTEGWYRDNTAQFKAAFEDSLLAVPRDADVLDDLRAFEMVRGVPRIPDGKTEGQSGGQRHGDAGISLLLAHFASRNAASPIEYTGAPGRHAETGDDEAEAGYRENRASGFR